MKKFVLYTAVILFFSVFVNADSYTFLSCTKDSKSQSFILANLSKFTMKLLYHPYGQIKPGGSVKLKMDSDAKFFSWTFVSDTEPYFTSLTYRWMATKNANKVTVKDNNSGLNGYPWVLTKLGQNAKLAITFESTACKFGAIGFEDSKKQIARFKVPGSVSVPIKDVTGKDLGVTLWNGQKFYSTTITIPKTFKGGKYKLMLAVKLEQKTIIDMTNDEKSNLKLSGCPALENFYIGVDAFIAHRNEHIPSEYDGRFFTKDVTKQSIYSSNMLSNKFSYNITYDKQINLDYPDGNVYVSSKPSPKTIVSLDPNSSKSIKFGIFDVKKHKTVIEDLTYWETTDDAKYYMIRVAMPTSPYYGSYIQMDSNKHFVVLACQDVSFDGSIEYKTKGFQFFQDRDYFISGIKSVKGNPYTQFGSKDYINMNMLVSELEAFSIVEKEDFLSFKMKSRYSKEPTFFEIHTDYVMIITSLKKTKIPITGKNVESNFFMNLNDLKQIIDVSIKTYPQSKSICMSVKQ